MWRAKTWFWKDGGGTGEPLSSPEFKGLVKVACKKPPGKAGLSFLGWDEVVVVAVVVEGGEEDADGGPGGP